jgi:hypothetical protein
VPVAVAVAMTTAGTVHVDAHGACEAPEQHQKAHADCVASMHALRLLRHRVDVPCMHAIRLLVHTHSGVWRWERLCVQRKGGGPAVALYAGGGVFVVEVGLLFHQVQRRADVHNALLA